MIKIKLTGYTELADFDIWKKEIIEFLQGLKNTKKLKNN